MPPATAPAGGVAWASGVGGGWRVPCRSRAAVVPGGGGPYKSTSSRHPGTLFPHPAPGLRWNRKSTARRRSAAAPASPSSRGMPSSRPSCAPPRDSCAPTPSRRRGPAQWRSRWRGGDRPTPNPTRPAPCSRRTKSSSTSSSNSRGISPRPRCGISSPSSSSVAACSVSSISPPTRPPPPKGLPQPSPSRSGWRAGSATANTS